MIPSTKEQLNNLDLPKAFRGNFTKEFEDKNSSPANSSSISNDLLPILELSIIAMTLLFFLEDSKQKL